ncbi:MAG: hypothetical protein J7M38_16000 [Armatimonadetes bacterium]|nr:hypothetical protein [Armatimonadota bacterium]
MKHRIVMGLVLLAICAGACAGADESPGPVFIRLRVLDPQRRFVVRIGGWGAGMLHVSPWRVPQAYIPADRKEWGDVSRWLAPGTWSPWVDLSDRNWHGRLNREGGIAEWPSLGIQLRGNDETGRVNAAIDEITVENANWPGHVRVEVQLATAAREDAVVKTFTEQGDYGQVVFLLPTPLTEHIDEFETGSQMAARHRRWAEEVTGGEPVTLQQMRVATSIWGHYDPALLREEIQTLKLLGFNAVNDGRWPGVLREMGVVGWWRTGFEPDPELQQWHWRQFLDRVEPQLEADENRRWLYDNAPWVIVSDEIRVLSLDRMVPATLRREFQRFLTSHHVEAGELGFEKMSKVKYPLEAIFEAKAPPRDAPLTGKRLFYWAARFGQWWSVRQLAARTALVKKAFPQAKTHTLPTDHGFLNAWGGQWLGMSYRLLDLFKLGRQHAVDYLGSEDWLGLNHMYGPGSTWTGAQTFEYFTTILGAGITKPDRQQIVAWITPSDEGFLRLKAFGALAQGAKHFYFWTYGPTYISTENYWSDLESEYAGIAKVLRDVAPVENVLFAARPMRDPVAILYSVSQDIWHPDDPACFVEKRLLWHALRHLGVQPRFVSEDDVAGGALADVKLLCVVDECVSRAAAQAIEKWVSEGGTLYCSALAAGRDEYDEPQSTLAFCQGIWPPEAQYVSKEVHRYNERGDLPNIPPMEHATLTLPGWEAPVTLPALGHVHRCRADQGGQVGVLDSGDACAVVHEHGRGRALYLGFLPMLAYGQGANFRPTTLEEKWPEQPRRIISWVLERAGVTPVVTTDVPVVEASLLSGGEGSVVVVSNFTYEPIESLTVTVRGGGDVSSARSVEHGQLQLERIEGGVRFRMPLDWTDLVVLQ